jgi:hypothetical protein
VRRHRCRYIRDNQEIGLSSDEVVVTAQLWLNVIASDP